MSRETRLVSFWSVILPFKSAAQYQGVSRSELTRKTQFLRRNIREEYMEDLIDSGEVVMKTTEGMGHSDLYFLKGFSKKG